jgi:hypothetical protein
MELRSYTRDKGRNIPSQIPNPWTRSAQNGKIGI